MNVTAVGQSDEHDIRKAAIETAMLDKEPSDAEVVKWIIETFPNPDYSPKQALARLCADRLEAAAAQIKSQADRIAELEAKLPSADTYRAVMDERARLAQLVSGLEKDAKRLDWMDSNVYLTFLSRRGDPRHIRQTIDTAMNERKE